MTDRSVTLAALVVGVIGGVYGVGGGSILGPILVGRGLPLARVAPAALASTFAASTVGCLTYAVLSLVEDGSIAPNWSVGLLCGVGGLAGAYCGARLQPFAPERGLRALLGVIAVALSILYLAQVVG